jgi:hypothetical protein
MKRLRNFFLFFHKERHDWVSDYVCIYGIAHKLGIRVYNQSRPGLIPEELGVNPLCNESTSSFGPEKLARLLKIGIEEDRQQNQNNSEVTNQDKVDLLHGILKFALVCNGVWIESLPEILQRAYLEPGSYIVGSSECVLANPAISLTMIKRIKHYTKALAKDTYSDPQCEIATVLYYSAIASALVFHNKMITKISYDMLCQSFSNLSSLTWLPPELVKLMQKALQICENKIRREN